MINEATIPKQGSDKIIFFYANATDYEGNSRKSPIGLYYIDNENSLLKILIINPHVKINLIKNTINGYRYTVDEIEFPEKFLNKTSNFHYWNIISNNYDFYITEPNNELSNILNESQLNVILLSSLSLGYKEAELLDWDIGDYNDQMKKLIEYVKNKHAGIIVTQGTLSDFVYWKNPDNTIKIGSKEHIGYKLEQINME